MCERETKKRFLRSFGFGIADSSDDRMRRCLIERAD